MVETGAVQRGPERVRARNYRQADEAAPVEVGGGAVRGGERVAVERGPQRDRAHLPPRARRPGEAGAGGAGPRAWLMTFMLRTCRCTPASSASCRCARAMASRAAMPPEVPARATAQGRPAADECAAAPAGAPGALPRRQRGVQSARAARRTRSDEAAGVCHAERRDQVACCAACGRAGAAYGRSERGSAATRRPAARPAQQNRGGCECASRFEQQRLTAKRRGA